MGIAVVIARIIPPCGPLEPSRSPGLEEPTFTDTLAGRTILMETQGIFGRFVGLYASRETEIRIYSINTSV